MTEVGRPKTEIRRLFIIFKWLKIDVIWNISKKDRAKSELFVFYFIVGWEPDFPKSGFLLPDLGKSGSQYCPKRFKPVLKEINNTE
jgi:hypothetical protein